MARAKRQGNYAGNVNNLPVERQFGQPNGNPIGRGGKTMRQWIGQLMKMDETELKEVVSDQKAPVMVRKAAALMAGVSDIGDLLKCVDAVESKPVEKVEQVNVFSNEDADKFREKYGF